MAFIYRLHGIQFYYFAALLPPNFSISSKYFRHLLPLDAEGVRTKLSFRPPETTSLPDFRLFSPCEVFISAAFPSKAFAFEDADGIEPFLSPDDRLHCRALFDGRASFSLDV